MKIVVVQNSLMKLTQWEFSVLNANSEIIAYLIADNYTPLIRSLLWCLNSSVCKDCWVP